MNINSSIQLNIMPSGALLMLDGEEVVYICIRALKRLDKEMLKVELFSFLSIHIAKKCDLLLKSSSVNGKILSLFDELNSLINEKYNEILELKKITN